MTLTNRCGFLVLALVAAAGAFAQYPKSTLDRIISEGKNHSQVNQILAFLSEEIGPRVTSSPNLAKAQTRIMDKLIGWGLKNVHLEQWGEFPLGWHRGKHQIGRMVEPFDVPFEFSTPCWAPGTSGPVRGVALRQPESAAEVVADPKKYRGAWIVMPRPVGMGGPSIPTPTELDTALDRAGIAGRVYSSGAEIVWASGRGRDITWDTRPRRVLITIRKPDYDRILRSLDRGRKVELEFGLENYVWKGPIRQYNVVADLPGWEHPEEQIIISAHLDSWDAPGSQGASDNGTGSSVMMEAIRILAKCNVRPRRTIRLVLWSGEEQGLLGSVAYVNKRRPNLDQIVAMFNDDGGSNYQGGLNLIPAWMPFFKPLETIMNGLYPDLPMKFNEVSQVPRGGGSDHVAFLNARVPGFHWNETGKQNYRYVWHTQYDRIENTFPDYLRQSATNTALAAYMLATHPERLPRPKDDQWGAGGRRPGGGLGDETFPDHDHDHDHDH